MKREEKQIIIASLAEKIKAFPNFYVTDSSGLNAEQTANLRRACYEKQVTMIVVKNTLFIKALEQVEKADSEIVASLKGSSAIMFSEVANVPAKLIKEFRKGAQQKPELKSAYVQDCVYIGENTLEELVNVKSRDELIADVIALLQSPAKNVISALQGSAGHKVAGIVKALEERQN